MGSMGRSFNTKVAAKHVYNTWVVPIGTSVLSDLVTDVIHNKEEPDDKTRVEPAELSTIRINLQR